MQQVSNLGGRIKAIVLSHTLSVAYAGLSSQGLDAIREVHRRNAGSISIAIDILRSASERFPDELDFIVCSHSDPTSPRLFKIQNGKLIEGSDFYWIGSARTANAVSKIIIDLGQGHNITDEQQIQEAKYTQAFAKHLSENLDPDIGGLLINCLCSPYGHCYQNHAGTSIERVQLMPQLHDEAVRLRDHKAGQQSFSYHVYSSPERGPAVVGCYFEQPEVGYLHAPLLQDDPLVVNASDQADFYTLLSKMTPTLLHAQSGA